jgi:serine/threonine protein kinase
MGSPDPQLPRMLGRYALYEKIASGGMASVHIGRLLGPVGFARTVAIKRMHPQLAEDPEFVSMFLDEARVAARIRHPNVVPTLDVVAMAGELFLVMEFVQGESLSRLVRFANARGERIPPEMVATMLVGVLHGLHAAHEAKSDHGEPLEIVHRDVSPHNVLVGIDGVARVLDFGVAKAVGRIHTTRDGTLKGKLAYMAPEQVRGQVSRVTDVYSAAVVLWEALTGKRLFQGENDAQVLDRVLTGCDVPPSTHAPGLPPALDEVTMRGLNVDPAKRFATAREFARAIEETMAPVTPSKIGDWVEAAAKDTLDERSARIATIESDSAVQGPQLPAMRFSPEGVTQSALDPPANVTDDGIPTQLSSGSASSPGRISLLGPRRRKAWLVASVAGLLLTAGVLVAVARHPSVPSTPPTPATSASPAGTSSVAAPATGTPPASPFDVPPPPADSASSAAAVAGPVPTVKTGAPRGGRPFPAPTRAPTSQPTAAPPAAPVCTVVTNYDADGQPHFTKVCK